MMSNLDQLLTGTPRALVVAAHPGHETIGAGILLSRLPGAWVLHLTDGAPLDRRVIAESFVGGREDYERARREELTAALALAGVAPQHLLRIEKVEEQEAAHHLPRLAREVAVLLRQLRPEVVVTHAYEGGHPDHDSAAFAVRAAVELLRRGRQQATPEIVEMALHQGFLPPTGTEEALELSPEERELKARMLESFVTQRDLLARQPPPVREVFRPAPRCDFGRPPHPGPLQYEISGAPIDGGRWRDLARDAVEELEMPGWRG